MQVKLMRKLVSDGWTIANRRQLQGVVGKKNMLDLASEFELLQKNNCASVGDVFVGKKYSYELIKDGQNLKFKLGISDKNNTQPEAEITLENENITKPNIYQTINQFYKKIIGENSMADKSGEDMFSEPKTMSKLFSPKFKPAKHVNKDGYFVTTVIDKKTDEPVEALLKRRKTKEKFEKWEMYVKHSDGKYERIGWRNININSKDKKITPEWMDSSEGNDRYSGIGIRLHQLGVERMLQSGCKTIEIDSLSSAFLFHYKCGFRSPDEIIYWGKKPGMKWWLEDNNITMEEWEKIAKPTYKENDMVYVNAKNLEEVKKLALIRNKDDATLCNTTMYLQGEFLNRWIERIKSQPILLDYTKS